MLHSSAGGSLQAYRLYLPPSCSEQKPVDGAGRTNKQGTPFTFRSLNLDLGLLGEGHPRASEHAGIDLTHFSTALLGHPLLAGYNRSMSGLVHIAVATGLCTIISILRDPA